MAVKHRKLFPAATNQTDCPDCPDCTYYCYPYADFYVPPPPPISAIDKSDESPHISPYVILLVSLLASLFILVGYYVIIVKSCTSFWSTNRNNGSPLSQTSSTDEEFAADQNQVDHPIWYISTVGLQQSVINSITVCKYKKGEGLIEGTECSVCLNEFHEDETLRLLPKCSHAFHIPCIDAWLRSHTNCPLCRANIVTGSILSGSNSVRPQILGSVDQNGGGMDTNGETQMENSETESEMGVNQDPDGAEDEGEEHQVGNEITSKEAINSNGDRPISMDSSPAETKLVIKLQNAEKVLHSSSMLRVMRQSSVVQCLHISPVLMKRSVSCGGRLRLLSLRRKWSMISVLPM